MLSSGWIAKANLYLDRRVVSIFILGIAQGFPWVMIGSVLTLWLKENGISRASIGYAGLIFTVYAANFLWAPAVDQFNPRLFNRLGNRQSWIILCQVFVIGGCLLMSISDPAINAKAVVLIGLLIAVSSATQDIAIDAYRVDSFAHSEPELISTGAAAATAGWWTGYAGLGYIPLRLSDMNWSWPNLYLLLAGLTLCLLVVTWNLPKPRYYQRNKQLETFSHYLEMSASAGRARKLALSLLIPTPAVICLWAIIGSPGLPEAVADHSAYIPVLIVVVLVLVVLIGVSITRLNLQNAASERNTVTNHTERLDRTLAWILTSLVAPLKDFFERSGVRFAIALFAFVLLFKIGEAFLGRMSIVFYKEVGFSNTDIANYSKMLTWWLTIIFALLGGLVNARFGLVKGLVVSGCAMAASNLMFAWIAMTGPDINLYIATIVVDGFAAAWSSVAFVSVISLLCNHSFSATQYALMASLSNLGRTTLSSISGQVVDWLNGNWSLFFVLTTFMVIPSLVILLVYLRKPIAEMEGRSKPLPDNTADRT